MQREIENNVSNIMLVDTDSRTRTVQERIASAGGIESVTAAMARFQDRPDIQER